MLNLGYTLEVKKLQMPIYFKKRNECVHCGTVGSLVFIDKFGNESRHEVKAFDHIKCKRCGRLYSILWESIDGSAKMYPSAVEPSISRDFMNVVNHSRISKNGSNDFR